MVKINRKSQGMPINVIIIATLSLIVLVVLAAIFTGRIKIFSENLQSCAAKQGRCETSSNEKWPTCPANMAYVSNTDCEKNKQICCVTVFNPT